MDKLSSTRLRMFLDCPRRYKYTYVDGKHPPTSEAMAVGTTVHAILEWRIRYGYWPGRHHVRRMKGNYDDPVDVLNAYPDIWELAYDMAVRVDVYDLIGPDMKGVVEKPLADFEQTFAGGVLATGFIDLWQDDVIIDFKTRGSLDADYVPTSVEDFHNDVQLCYYASVLQRARGYEAVTVKHINILRSSEPRVKVVEATLDAWYLKRVWQELDGRIVPAMRTIHETGSAHTNRASCFTYGPCPHLSYCEPDNHDNLDFLELNMQIISDEAPPDIEAVPYANKTIDVLGTNRTVIASLHEAGVYTLDDLDTWLDDEDNDLTDLSGCGDKTADDIMDVLGSLRKTRGGEDCNG